MNLSTVNNSKSQRRESSRLYILESESRITNGKGVSINKLGMVIVFKGVFSKVGFVLILYKKQFFKNFPKLPKKYILWNNRQKLS